MSEATPTVEVPADLFTGMPFAARTEVHVHLEGSFELADSIVLTSGEFQVEVTPDALAALMAKQRQARKG